MTLAAFCCAMTMAVLTACTSDNNDNPESPDSPANQTEYAILFYGYGGSNLDMGIFNNMMDFFKGQGESRREQLLFLQL